LRKYYFAKKLQSRTLTGEKFQKTHSDKKAAHKMLMKLTPVDPTALPPNHFDDCQSQRRRDLAESRTRGGRQCDQFGSNGLNLLK